MKLVEILARELKEWPPETEVLGQGGDGTLHLSARDAPNKRWTKESYTMADDWSSEDVTRGEWAAERARIAMEGVSAFSQEQANAEAEREKIAKDWWRDQMRNQPIVPLEIASVSTESYEQELWDKVTVASMSGLIASDAFHGYLYQQNPVQAAIFGADCADAFMTERAKRLASK